jgi:hypothetical protein
MKRLNYIIEIKSLKIPLMHDTFASAQQVSMAASEGISYLTNILGISEKQKRVQELSSLREEFKSITTDFFTETGVLVEDYEKNYLEALRLYEKSEFLASSLAVCRIFLDILDQVKNPDELREENKGKTNPPGQPEVVVSIFKGEGLLDDDTGSIQKLVMGAGKIIRNHVAHDITYFPDASSTMQVLAGFLQLFALYKKFLTKKKQESEEPIT